MPNKSPNSSLVCSTLILFTDNVFVCTLTVLVNPAICHSQHAFWLPLRGPFLLSLPAEGPSLHPAAELYMCLIWGSSSSSHQHILYLYTLLFSHLFTRLLSKSVLKPDRKVTTVFFPLGLLPVKGKKTVSLDLGKQTHLSLQEDCRAGVWGRGFECRVGETWKGERNG